jgi:hypothetical protein
MKRFQIQERAPGFYTCTESTNGEWVGYVDAVADRRERIATAVLAGRVSRDAVIPSECVSYAIRCADALITELDKPKGEK